MVTRNTTRYTIDRPRAGRLLLSTIFCSLLGLTSAARAEVPPLTDSEVVSAIEKASILAPSIRINARISDDEVMVATYKNPKAVDSDCKIEAVLVAKAIMDLAPGRVPRVTVYFYSATSLSRFKAVTVTAGDVKAFGSGSLSKDELLASIQIKEDKIVDSKKRIDEYLQEASSQRRHKVVTTLKDDVLTLSTYRDASLNERNLKYQAFTMAEQAFEAAPTEVGRVVINFRNNANPPQNEVISFSKNDIDILQKAISAPLDAFNIELVKAPEKPPVEAVVQRKVDAQTLVIKDGLLKDERQKLLDRMKALSDAGVNYGPTPLEAMAAIEDAAGGTDETALQEKISKLSDLLDRFESNLKAAKDHVIVGKDKGATTGGAATNVTADVNAPSGGPAPVANPEEAKKMILADPDAFVQKMADGLITRNVITGKVIGKFQTADEHPNFKRILQFVIDTLKAANRTGDAARFEKRLEAVKAKAVTN